MMTNLNYLSFSAMLKILDICIENAKHCYTYEIPQKLKCPGLRKIESNLIPS